jgi:hypothetical protein
MIKNVNHCSVCKTERNVVYWNKPDSEKELPWCYCCACGRAYNIMEYCHLSEITLTELLNEKITFSTPPKNEVQRIAWPAGFIRINDSRAKKGLDYIISRGLSVEGDMFYDMDSNGVVFPLYFKGYFCGAQVRLLNPYTSPSGKETKMISLPGTRTSILIYGWDQGAILGHIKAIVIAEGAFNALSIQQSLNDLYGDILKNPFKCIALSGSAGSHHHLEIMKELKDRGYKIIMTSDLDPAGIKMLQTFTVADCLTHYAIMDRPNVGDWNDMLVKVGKKEFAKYFLGRIVPIEKNKLKKEGEQ